MEDVKEVGSVGDVLGRAEVLKEERTKSTEKVVARERKARREKVSKKSQPLTGRGKRRKSRVVNEGKKVKIGKGRQVMRGKLGGKGQKVGTEK